MADFLTNITDMPKMGKIRSMLLQTPIYLMENFLNIQLALYDVFFRRVLFNKWICCILSDDNPHAIVETPINPQKVTIWCALLAEGIIGPYFFKKEAIQNVTVYNIMLQIW